MLFVICVALHDRYKPLMPSYSTVVPKYLKVTRRSITKQHSVFLYGKLQMESLRPALQQTVEEWSCFDSDLREVSLHTTRLRCALQYQPLFSLKQAEGYKDLLQVNKSTDHPSCTHVHMNALQLQ